MASNTTRDIEPAVENSILKWSILRDKTRSTSVMGAESACDIHSSTESTVDNEESLEQNMDNDNVSYKLVVIIITELNENKQKPTHINVIKQFESRGVSESIGCELIQQALDKLVITEYSYYKKPAYRLTSESPIIIEDGTTAQGSQTDSHTEFCGEDAIERNMSLDSFTAYKDQMNSEMASLAETYRLELNEMRNEIADLKKQLLHQVPLNASFLQTESTHFK